MQKDLHTLPNREQKSYGKLALSRTQGPRRSEVVATTAFLPLRERLDRLRALPSLVMGQTIFLCKANPTVHDREGAGTHTAVGVWCTILKKRIQLLHERGSIKLYHQRAFAWKRLLGLTRTAAGRTDT